MTACLRRNRLVYAFNEFLGRGKEHIADWPTPVNKPRTGSQRPEHVTKQDSRGDTADGRPDLSLNVKSLVDL
ncbi:hypothetical protein TNCV_2601271 [Trichonephila clavipes]|nr:hypothetical protein TNCV_2601271 [Trichonephila clavipes]